MSAELYERMWAHSAYRRVAPGEFMADKFLDIARPDSRVIDFGAGTGRGAAKIAKSVPVLALDFASNCLDEAVRGSFEFRQHDLREPIAERAQYGFCTDVLEHIAPDDVDTVLRNIFDAADKVFLAISTTEDHFGPALAGEPLHLTVESPYWWHDKLTQLGINIGWSQSAQNVVCFYGSQHGDVEMYVSAGEVRAEGKLNIEQEAQVSNIRANLELGLRELIPHQPQPDTVVYLLGGGPSLNEFTEAIVDGGKNGIPCVTVNGTYKWLIDKGIKPAAQVLTDGRDFNKRFTVPIIDTCQYLIASQCNPAVVQSVPAENTWLWHAAGDIPADTIRAWLDEKGINREWYPVHGGATVIVCAVVILAMLGYRKLEVFGWDSCFMGDEHHAYPQKENDADPVHDVVVGDRTFRCAPWMLLQADDALRVVKYVVGMIDDFEMVVHGDGLIANLLKSAAAQEH